MIAGGKPSAAILISTDYDYFLDDDPDLPVPFIRLHAESVLENSRHWHIIQDGFNPFTCQACHRYLSAMQAEARQIARQLQLALPESYYRYAPYACWRCGGEMLVFTWPEKGIHSFAVPEKEPVPRTIQYRFSNMAGHSYWVNTCPHCQVIQGDFFLAAEPDGPFFTLNCGPDTVAAFQQDLMTIAAHLADATTD